MFLNLFIVLLSFFTCQTLSFLQFDRIMPRYSTRGSVRALSMGPQVKITSYNVLSNHLAAPSHFTSCNPAHLDGKYRFESLKAKLDAEVKSNAIICLQEVSHSWAGALHAFFSQRGYHFITGLYGNKFNGYMGVAVAVPLSKYEIDHVDITRIADTKQMPRSYNKPKPTFWSSFVNTMKSYILKLAEYFKWYRPPVDLWDNVLYRTNQMITARLKEKESQKKFVIGTYHMPCMFKLPSVMLVHTALSAQHIQRVAVQKTEKAAAAGDQAATTEETTTLPYIYVGDFNFKPKSSQYELVTQGKIDVKHPDYPVNVPEDKWCPDLVTPMRSAYAEQSGGEEPNFTNYAKTAFDKEPFIDTLDYIFLSKEWKVEEVVALPHRDDIAGPLPNKEEPSDHLLISAQLSLVPPSPATSSSPTVSSP